MPLLIECNEIKKAKDLLNSDSISTEGMYNAARMLYKVGYYQEADVYFTKVKSVSDLDCIKSQCDYYQKKIRDYMYFGQFIKIEYKYYKYHHTLQPGDIIYTKYEDSSENNSRRPILIWKLEGDNVFGFPITKNVMRPNGKKKGYLIRGDQYKNFDGDRALKYSLLNINTSEVGRIIEHIKPRDLDKILRSARQGIIKIGTSDILETNKKFLDEYKIEIVPESIILLPNHNNNNYDFYFVIDVDKEKKQCKGLLLEKKGDEIDFVSDEPTIISLDQDIVNCIRPKDDKKEQILKKAPYVKIYKRSN